MCNSLTRTRIKRHTLLLLCNSAVKFGPGIALEPAFNLRHLPMADRVPQFAFYMDATAVYEQPCVWQ